MAELDTVGDPPDTLLCSEIRAIYASQERHKTIL